nr:MAG TPA: hypothetical protein [Caudoviricetes sp.]
MLRKNRHFEALAIRLKCSFIGILKLQSYKEKLI